MVYFRMLIDLSRYTIYYPFEKVHLPTTSSILSSMPINHRYRVPSLPDSVANTPSDDTPREKSAALPASSAKPYVFDAKTHHQKHLPLTVPRSALPRPSPLKPKSVPMALAEPPVTIST